MENGYKILWMDNALLELKEIYDYLEVNWTARELRNLSIELEKTLILISRTLDFFKSLNTTELGRLL